MDYQKSQPLFRLFKLPNAIKRGFIKHPITIRIKNKPISKYAHFKCEHHCQHHHFSLRKIDSDYYTQLNKQICDVSLTFCPQINEVLQTVHGGIPNFRNDHRIDTPCFAPRFEVFTQTDDEMYRTRFQKMKSTAEMSISDQQNNEQQDTQTATLDHELQAIVSQTSFQMSIDELDHILKRK